MGIVPVVCALVLCNVVAADAAVVRPRRYVCENYVMAHRAEPCLHPQGRALPLEHHLAADIDTHVSSIRPHLEVCAALLVRTSHAPKIMLAKLVLFIRQSLRSCPYLPIPIHFRNLLLETSRDSPDSVSDEVISRTRFSH